MINILKDIIVMIALFFSIFLVLFISYMYERRDGKKNKELKKQQAHDRRSNLYKEIDPFVIDTIRKHGQTKKE